jgi:hypothetical protein
MTAWTGQPYRAFETKQPGQVSLTGLSRTAALKRQDGTARNKPTKISATVRYTVKNHPKTAQLALGTEHHAGGVIK